MPAHNALAFDFFWRKHFFISYIIVKRHPCIFLKKSKGKCLVDRKKNSKCFLAKRNQTVKLHLHLISAFWTLLGAF